MRRKFSDGPKPARIPRRAKTLRLKGEGDAEGKYYRCWYCGFICDKERDALGDSQSGSGVNHESYVVPKDPGALSGYGVAGDGTTPLAQLILMGGEITHFHVALENGMDGTPKSIAYSFELTNGTGCPLCNSLNWRGDYP